MNRSQHIQACASQFIYTQSKTPMAGSDSRSIYLVYVGRNKNIYSRELPTIGLVLENYNADCQTDLTEEDIKTWLVFQ